MTLKLLGIGDPHIEKASDIDENFTQSVREVVEAEDIDEIIIPGDVIDPLPIDRAPSDIKAGRAFFEAINAVGVPVNAVSGNHDYDIHSDITEEFENVENMNYTSRTVEINGDKYTIIGRGAQQFDQGPELPLETINKYGGFHYEQDFTGNSSLDQLEDDLWYLVREVDLEEGEDEDFPYSDFEDFFDVEHEMRPEFRDALDEYRAEFERMDELFSNAEGTVVYLNHSPPLNTSIDLDREDRHTGSLVDKHLWNIYNPELSSSGHLHAGSIEYVTEGSDTRILSNLGKRQMVVMEVNESESPQAYALNQPDL